MIFFFFLPVRDPFYCNTSVLADPRPHLRTYGLRYTHMSGERNVYRGKLDLFLSQHKGPVLFDNGSQGDTLLYNRSKTP